MLPLAAVGAGLLAVNGDVQIVPVYADGGGHAAHVLASGSAQPAQKLLLRIFGLGRLGDVAPLNFSHVRPHLFNSYIQPFIYSQVFMRHTAGRIPH